MSEYKDKDIQDLQKTLKEKRDALHTFTINVLNGKEKNVKSGKALRKDIARILTELNVSADTSKKAKTV